MTDEEMIEMLTKLSANPDQIIADTEEFETLFRLTAEYLEKADISTEEFMADVKKHRLEWEAMSLKDRIRCSFVYSRGIISARPRSSVHGGSGTFGNWTIQQMKHTNEPTIIFGHWDDSIVIGDVELRLYQSGIGWRVSVRVEPSDEQFDDFPTRAEQLAEQPVGMPSIGKNN